MYVSTRRCCYLILKVIRALWGETLIDTLTKETDMNNEPTLDDVFAVAAENNANIDLSSIFPGPGTYLVKADAAIPGLNRTEPDHHRPYLRVPLTIEAAVDDETSKLPITRFDQLVQGCAGADRFHCTLPVSVDDEQLCQVRRSSEPARAS